MKLILNKREKIVLAKYWIYRLEDIWGDELNNSSDYKEYYLPLKSYLIDQGKYVKDPSLHQKIALQFAIPQKYYNIDYKKLRDDKFPNLFKVISATKKPKNEKKKKAFTYAFSHHYSKEIEKQFNKSNNYTLKTFKDIPKPKAFADSYIRAKDFVDKYFPNYNKNLYPNLDCSADSEDWRLGVFLDMNKFLIAITPTLKSDRIETLLDQINQEKLNLVNTKKKQEESFKLPIEVPTGTTWNQITITVFDDEHLIIKVPNDEVRIDFANAGFADKRAKDKSKWKPNETWKILLEMAESKMIHKDKHYAILSRGKGEPKQRLYKLNQTLRKLIMIDDNPINRYNRRNGGWIPKFNLIDKRDQTYNPKSEIEKLKKYKKI